ncbi:hypothetical protein CFC21_042198 [Triticum aestivum]|uniref:3'-5' exonuclease domain-containing protein n=3 Tax=Triticum TaxID=4564 RepID=A0A9R1JV75_WHEAT|nr:hypothetical protein CFC21_042198 [Triticum aestivum]CDM84103.1 unnamed protein product [Triticum aestivum]VAH79735.1 unnamed protein product [Triticum turgidum subsp. durum]
MAEELSAKRQCSETSDQSSNLDDVHVPGEKREYTRTLTGVEIHGKEMLEVVCTSKPDKAEEMISRLWRKAGGLYPRFVGVHVEYTREDEPPQRSAVMQLCVEELCLVYHVATATKCKKTKKLVKHWPKSLNDMLKHEKLFTFVGFNIQGDKEKLKMYGFEINPNKKEDHNLWGISPLPNYLIEYTTIDVYATYKSWKIIDNISTGLEISKE